MSISAPVAGWYRDPTGRHELRYWDGAMWTTAVRTDGARQLDPDLRPPSAPVPAATHRPAEAGRAATRAATRPRSPMVAGTLTLGGAALIALGSALPWAEAQVGSHAVSKSGIDGDGTITIALAAFVVACFVALPKSRRLGVLVAVFAAAAGAVALHNIIDVSQKADDLAKTSTAAAPVSAGVGIGSWITLGAAVITFVGGLALVAAAPKRSDAAPA
jgi:hypothetical protein